MVIRLSVASLQRAHGSLQGFEATWFSPLSVRSLILRAASAAALIVSLARFFAGGIAYTYVRRVRVRAPVGEATLGCRGAQRIGKDRARGGSK